jgi:hypothetical protein
MKNFAIFSLVIVLAFAITGCNKDDDGNNAIYNALGTVRISGDSTLVILDNDQRMLVENADELTSTPSNGMRIWAYFTITSETDPHVDLLIRMISWDQILFKSVIKLTAANSDSLGNDPIGISNVWVAKDYLNVSFSFYALSGLHSFDLARVSGTSTDTITVEIRHNAKQDAQSNLYSGVMTFDLTSLRSATADSVVLDVKAKVYGDRSYNEFFTYKY